VVTRLRAVVASTLLAGLVLTGCGKAVAPASAPLTPGSTTASPHECASGRVFALSLVRDTGGAPTPERAAEVFAANPSQTGVTPAPHGWTVTARDAHGAKLVAGRVELHAVRGRDGTWQVDSGEVCN